jgi:hypothetical protein
MFVVSITASTTIAGAATTPLVTIAAAATTARTTASDW